MTLQESAEQGEKLTADQEDAVSKLGEVQLQLELVKDLQKQFTSLNSEVNRCLYIVHVHVQPSYVVYALSECMMFGRKENGS